MNKTNIILSLIVVVLALLLFFVKRSHSVQPSRMVRHPSVFLASRFQGEQIGKPMKCEIPTPDLAETKQRKDSLSVIMNKNLSR